MPRTISVGEQISILMEIGSGRIGEDMASRGEMGRIFKTSRDILAFIVRHEVAHIKFNWDASLDRECSRWALAPGLRPGSGPSIGQPHPCGVKVIRNGR